ncbi:MAG: LLM class flavin-dependent oxidoreductase, partial [Dehalococcoidia bacterium]
MRFSVGIVGNEPLPKLVEYVKLAEDLGYYGAWIADTQLVIREAYVIMAACAMRTSRIKLGTGVTMPHTRHPSVTASAFATLNEIAPGRLRVGISIGDTALRTIGRRRATIKELEEYVSLLRGLLDNRKVPFEGGVEGKIAWMEAPPEIPIYVAATGPRLTRAAARMSDCVMLLRGVAAANLEDGIKSVREVASQAGRSPDRMDVVAWAPTSMAPDRALARGHAQILVAEVLKMCDLGMFGEEDRPTIQRIQEEYDLFHQSWTYSDDRAPVPDKFIDMFALVGTPEEVRGQVVKLAEVDGLNEIVIAARRLRGGKSPPVEWVLRNFAEGVMGRV